MSNFLKKQLVVAVAMSLPGMAFSQALEEVVVTAQKRAQSLQDVPVAVSALSGDWMKQNNVADLEDVAALVPNLSLSGTPGINTVRIRGLGTGGGNAAFEQSVGMYVDGIYAGRGYQFNLPYLDVERIEVLKGPQGVLFGKNSIAGAISITSARPSPEFEGQIGLSYEAENEGYSVETVINGELMPGLSGRLAASYIEEGGWIDNTLLNEDDQPEVEMGGYRASLLWEASDTVEVYFKYDHGEYEKTGSEMGIRHIVPGSTNPFMPGNPTWSSLYEAADPDVGLVEDHKQSAGVSLTGEFDGYFKDVESDAVTLQVDWDLGEHTLTLLSGYSTYEVDTFSDQSFSPLTVVNQHGEEEFSQFTQEVRLTSPLGETFEYIVGMFYMDRSLEFPARYTDLEFTQLFGATLPAPAPPLPTELVAASSLKQYDEDTESISVFGQVTWNISDVFRSSLGLRYSHEEKDGEHSHVLYDLGTTTPLNPVGVAAYDIQFNARDYAYSDDRKEETVDPSLNVQWDVNSDLMVYAAATRATKAGGYNAGNLSGDPATLEFEEEEATGYEIGSKGEFLDNQLRLNVAAFYTEFDNLQVSALDGNSGNFFIGNAAKAISKGLEADATYVVSDTVTVGGALAYLDGSFDEFPGAPCANSIYRQEDCVGDGPSASRDAEGETMIHSPDWSGNLYIDYLAGLTEGTVLGVRVDAVFVDDFGYSLTYADPLSQKGYVKWNARLSLAAEDESWELALVGKNLTDKTTTSFGDATFQSPGVYFGNVDAPRQIFINATWRFW
jgi:outer membrane receptor protein involved in Fe transport